MEIYVLTQPRHTAADRIVFRILRINDLTDLELYNQIPPR